MRRMLLMALASGALAVPAVATAHQARHHSRSHHHAKHARVLHFGSIRSMPGSAPTTPTSPTPPTPAGTIKSFTEGVLTITLADGKTMISGKVTEDTRLICAGASGPGDNDEGDEDGDQHARVADHGSGDGPPNLGDEGNSQGEDGEQGADHDDDEEVTPCTTNALTPGASVLFAELRLGSSGPAWEVVVLG